LKIRIRSTPLLWAIAYAWNHDRFKLGVDLSGGTILVYEIDTRSILPGDSVFTVSFAPGATTDTAPRFSDGSLTAVSGPDAETAFLQMTVPVQPGGSGGPVVAADGSVVGVVSSGAAIILLLREPGIFPQNVSWAIKADFARPLFEQPPALPATKTRSEAIDRATRSACRVLVTR
jgi:S1-C subfamily serine protease